MHLQIEGAPPAFAPEIQYRKLAQLGVCATAIGGSAAIRWADFGKAGNALASLGVGGFTAALLRSAYEGEALLRIQKIGSTILFGQLPNFIFSQLFAKTGSQISVDAITAMCGGTLVFWIARYLNRHITPIEVGENAGEPLIKIDPRWEKIAFIAQVALGISCCIGLGLTTDPILKTAFSAFSLHFFTKICGKKAIDLLEWSGRRENDKYSKAAKVGLLALAHLGRITSYLAWTTFGITGAPLMAIGAAIGLANGILFQNSAQRAARIPASRLPELRTLSAPEWVGCEHKKAAALYATHKSWRYLFPLTLLMGMSTFAIQQLAGGMSAITDNAKTDAYYAIGSIWPGFSLSFLYYQWADRQWTLRASSSLNNAFVSLWFDPQICGIDPLFVYHVAFNALRRDPFLYNMSPYHFSAQLVGSLAFGITMGREITLTSSERMGNFGLDDPLMAGINSGTTALEGRPWGWLAI